MKKTPEQIELAAKWARFNAAKTKAFAELQTMFPDQLELPLTLKPGREVLDPMNRVVTIIKVEGPEVTVRLGGSYGATVRYPASCLRPTNT